MFQEIKGSSVIDWGVAFVKGTYHLEGDGPLAFTAYKIFQSIVSSIQVENAPNVNAVIKQVERSIPIFLLVSDQDHVLTTKN